MANPEIAQSADAALASLYEKEANRFKPLATAAFNLAGEAESALTPVIEAGNLYSLPPENGRTRALRLTLRPPNLALPEGKNNVVKVHLQIDDPVNGTGATLELGTFVTHDKNKGPTLSLSAEYQVQLAEKGVDESEGEKLVGGFVFQATCAALGVRPPSRFKRWTSQMFNSVL